MDGHNTLTSETSAFALTFIKTPSVTKTLYMESDWGNLF